MKKRMLVVLGMATATGWSAETGGSGLLSAEFAAPPFRCQSRPLWFWNGRLDTEKTKAMVAACKAAGYYGMGILPCKGMGFDFMSPEFLTQSKKSK